MKRLVIFSAEPKNMQELDIIPFEETQALFQKEYKPQPKDVIYIFPGCTVPRIKMKAFCDKYDVRLTNSRTKANVFIGSLPTMESYYFINHGWCIDTLVKPLIQYMKKYANNCGNLGDDLEVAGVETVIIGKPAYYEFANNGLDGTSSNRYEFVEPDEDLKPGDVVNCFESVQVRYFRTDLLKADFESFATSGLYDQSALLHLINADAAKIDESMYESLRSMFLSKNSEDIKIAMEIMANADNRTSLAYILFIFHEFGHDLFNSPTKHHVNFKSLLKYLNYNLRYQNMHIDTCVDTLRDKKLLTHENMSILMRKAQEIVRDSGETTHFKVREVIPSEDVRAIMDSAEIPEPEITSL